MTKAADMKSKPKRADKEKVTPRWILENIFGLIRRFGATVIWAAVIVYGLHVMGSAITAFAGRTSIANLAVDLATHLNLTIACSISLSGVTSALWVNEYRRHRKTRERLTKRITMLETRIDPNRTSSKLTSEGMTQEGDL